MRVRYVIFGLGLTALFSFGVMLPRAHADDELPAPETVPSVDLKRYLGKWYEIATLPSYFQRDCVASTAEYSLREDGDIKVVNTCRKKTLEGDTAQVEGKAWIVDKVSNSKLKVQFFWPFSGDYWILELDPEYRYVVVGNPKRKNLWIMAREPQMEDKLFEQLRLKILSKHRYNLAELKKTLQPSKP